MWPYCNETRKLALHPTPTPAPSVVSTLSIRRMSNHTMHTISLPNLDFSDNDPPPAPTRSPLSMRVALRNFTAQEQQDLRAGLDEHTEAKSPTLLSWATTQSPRSRSSSVRRFSSTRSGHSETQGIRPSLRNGHRPQVVIVINPSEQVPDVPQSVEGPTPPDSVVHASDFRRMPPPRKHNNRVKRSSTSSELTYLTPISQNTSSQRPSYLLSPSTSYRQSAASMSRTPIPTWEETYRQQGLQFDRNLDIPPLPSLSVSANHQFTLPHTPAVPYVPSITGPPVSLPPGLTKLQPVTRSSLSINPPPVRRTGGIKGPRPLVTTSRSRGRTLRDMS